MNPKVQNEFSFNKNLDHVHLDKIKNVKINPVFILGLPRSGTSILYKILSETNLVNYVTTYHVISYNQLLYNYFHNNERKTKSDINDYFTKVKLKDRGMDKLKIYADFPEEYGYILGKKTFQMSINCYNKSLFINLCKKIQFISENNKPLLLKNPYDIQNVNFIKIIFPNAKFIIISRNPEKILNSSMKAINSLLKTRHPYSMITNKNYSILFNNPLFLSISRFIFKICPIIGMNYLIHIFNNHIRKFSNHIYQIPTRDFIVTSYEKLCEKPNKTIKQLLDFIEVESRNKYDFNTYIEPRNIPVDPLIIKFRRLIKTRMKTYYDLFAYK